MPTSARAANRAVMVGEDGKELPHGGRYLTIEPPRLLVFTFRWEEPDATETEMRINFEPDGSGTKLTLTQAPFDDVEELNRMLVTIPTLSDK